MMQTTTRPRWILFLVVVSIWLVSSGCSLSRKRTRAVNAPVAPPAANDLVVTSGPTTAFSLSVGDMPALEFSVAGGVDWAADANPPAYTIGAVAPPPLNNLVLSLKPTRNPDVFRILMSWVGDNGLYEMDPGNTEYRLSIDRQSQRFHLQVEGVAVCYSAYSTGGTAYTPVRGHVYGQIDLTRP